MPIRKLRCSFCRKTEDQVSKLAAGPRLITGPRLYICNECVAIATSVMEGNSPPTRAISRSILERVKERWRHLLQRCVAQGFRCISFLTTPWRFKRPTAPTLAQNIELSRIK
ncbi:MAG: hypothetical protein HKM94_06075 [Halobacteria archaeon]|nr:hypothetical protein [Halobacteria archaeon]